MKTNNAKKETVRIALPPPSSSKTGRPLNNHYGFIVRPLANQSGLVPVQSSGK
jgi:hypothetical protein